MRCFGPVRPLLLAAAVAITAGAASAADAPKGDHKPDLYVPDGHGGYAKATKAQIDEAAGVHAEDKMGFIDIKRYDLGIYTLLVFGVLLFVLSRFAWPNIAAGLKKREQDIVAAKVDAVRSKEEAEALRGQLQKDLAAAQDQVRVMLDQARKDAESLRVQEREAGAKEAAAERERAKREIEAAKDAALTDIYEQAVELATTLSSKTLARSISADDHRQLLQASLSEIRQAAKTPA